MGQIHHGSTTTTAAVDGTTFKLVDLFDIVFGIERIGHAGPVTADKAKTRILAHGRDDGEEWLRP